MLGRGRKRKPVTRLARVHGFGFFHVQGRRFGCYSAATETRWRCAVRTRCPRRHRNEIPSALSNGLRVALASPGEMRSMMS